MIASVVMRWLTWVAWLTIVATAIASTVLMFSVIDDGNPNTRDGWMGSWVLVVIPTSLVYGFWSRVFRVLAKRQWSRDHRAEGG